MSAHTLHRAANVVELADGILESAGWPLVPDAEYLASYQDHDCLELVQFGRQPKVFIRFRLFDAGEHTGKVLFRAYRVKRRLDGKRFVLGPRSDLMRTLCVVLDYRSRPDRISLRELKRHLVRIRTRTVVKDAHQREMPAVLRYSVVEDVLGKGT